MSHYLDLYLQEYIRDLPSFVKDSDAVIRSLNTFTCTEKTNLLTLDVTALYSNIDHQLGVNAIDTLLKADPEVPEAQQQFFLESLRFILENHFFVYDQSVYRQRMGTVMGTRVAPSYANLFMSLFKEKFIYSTHKYRKCIKYYIGYIDDLIIWKGTVEDASGFTDYLNNNTWGIEFTKNFNQMEIEFQDLKIKIKDNTFTTSTHFKKSRHT